jgi:TRAP-type uncharacterized transport system fused permease subunit
VADGEGRPALLIPIGVLIWCLMIEELSPSLSAFWATVTLMGLMVTQRLLTAVFRKQSHTGELKRGIFEVIEGLNDGARNMIGIGIATGTAGIIVGGITLTGLGLRMTDFVEVVSQGNVIAMLLFTAFVCLVLGLGVPTTANYILVATLMAPVIVELGAQSGLIIPLIAVHLFVFYFGIRRATSRRRSVSRLSRRGDLGEDPIKTGIQGSIYALRTVVLRSCSSSTGAVIIDARLVGDRAGGVCRDRRLCVCRGDDELVPDEVPMVGSRAAAHSDLRAVPTRFLHELHRRSLQGRAGEGRLCRREGARRGRPDRHGDRGHQCRGR